MNFAIQPCQSLLPVAPGRLSSASRVHVGLSHGSLGVSQCSKGGHLVSRPLHLHVMGTLDRFSERNEENGKKNIIVRGMGGASLVLACVVGAFSLSDRMNPKPNVAYAAHAGGPVCSELGDLIARRKVKDREPEPLKIEALKLYAMALSYRQGTKAADKAEKMLLDKWQTWQNSSASTPLKMALIELLIYQKKYPKAKDELNELRAKEDSLVGVAKDEIDRLEDIVDSMLKKEKEAAETSKEEYPTQGPSDSRFPKPQKYK